MGRSAGRARPSRQRQQRAEAPGQGRVSHSGPQSGWDAARGAGARGDRPLRPPCVRGAASRTWAPSRAGRRPARLSGRLRVARRLGQASRTFCRSPLVTTHRRVCRLPHGLPCASSGRAPRWSGLRGGQVLGRKPRGRAPAPPAWTRPACDMPPPGHRFATQERNALLLYNGRFNEKHDFIALEIVDEQVQLTFSAGRAPRGQSGSPAGAGQVKGAPTSRGALGCAHGSAPCPRPGTRPLGRPGTCKGACHVRKSGGTAQRPGPGTRRSAAHGGPRRSRAGRGGRTRPDAQRGAWPPPAHLCFLSAPPPPQARPRPRWPRRSPGA